MIPLRVVLDTNVLVSALLFSRGHVTWLRRSWQRGPVVPLLMRETTEELLRVLGYPKFRLSPREREDLLADLLPYCEAITDVPSETTAPACRDPDDQKFLHLALAARADAVITGDRDLIALAEDFEIEILTPAALHARLESKSIG